MWERWDSTWEGLETVPEDFLDAGDQVVVTVFYSAQGRGSGIHFFGALFALTIVTAIAGLILYDPVLNDADYVLGDGSDTRVQAGALAEIFLVITNIGTAIVIFPIVRRQSETLALTYIASRIVESVVIAVGLISLLSVVTLREEFAGGGADAESLTVAGEALVAIHDFTFLLGPGFCVGVNGLVLGYLFYKSGLVPRQLRSSGSLAVP